ncbi:MAG TPA: radical SAM protein, partial [Spirochaetota bacterium]|nr:radical SAM protein [Spirochaetota bacterium]
MKTHITIPFFIPHEGCINQCVFCNQGRISGRTSPVEPSAVRATVLKYIEGIPSGTIVEAAFFGGSFTAIPADRQEALLNEAFACLREGLISNIRLSTRPDCIDTGVIERLSRYGVRTVELGAQSFDDEILIRSKRGHSRADIFRASDLLVRGGFELVLQLMIGLPGETPSTIRESAASAASLSPAGVRIYPTLVVAGTELAKLFESGEYIPLSMDKAIAYSAELISFFELKGIRVLRTGIHPMEHAEESVIAGPYHPAFGFLARSRVRRNELEKILPRSASSSHGKICIA